MAITQEQNISNDLSNSQSPFANSSVLQVYKRSGLAFEKGQGCYLYTIDGKKYLDFASGIAVNCLGHCHPELVKTLQEQAEKYWHVSNGHFIPEQEELAKLICELTFADKVFFSNSGGEAIDCAIKMARRYFYGQNINKHEIICCTHAFHGRTIAGIAASGQQKMIEGFDPLLPGFKHVPFNDIKAVQNAITPETAAIMLEPIQGEGGIHIATTEFLNGIKKLADEHNLLLIFDEIQCGAGRTGKLFFYEHTDITPDIMTIAKGMGGGIPIGACLASDKVAQYMPIGSHGSTYGGNPLATKISHKAMSIISQPDFLAHVIQISEHLISGLKKLIDKYPTILKQVRNLGLMIGLQPHIQNIEMIKLFRERHLITVGGGDNIVRMLPPLILTEKECDEAFDIIDNTCKHIQNET